ncbi:hypothetical protein RhiirB3_440859 [Rhizophagus irregularis]|nr:hypothetical protein RhiirB3_440859 [Rhizophagus irregularis]
MGPVVDSNEAIRCEYISTILHTAVSLLKDLLILPWIMQSKNHRRSCDMNLNMLKKKRKSDEAFGSERHQNPTELRKNVKRVLEVIVGLLKDRISASEEPTNKKCHVEEIIKEKITLSELEVLKQRITELEAENAELKTKKADSQYPDHLESIEALILETKAQNWNPRKIANSRPDASR